MIGRLLALVVLLATVATAQTPQLVRDINTAPVGSEPVGLTAVGGALFFFAEDADGRWTLWTTDGTPGGTTRLADYRPVGGGAPPTNTHPTAVGNRLFFVAQGPTSTEELWVSDGTPAGTRKVTDTFAVANILRDVRQIFDFAGTAFFIAPTAAGDTGLWRSDGTAGGTTLVASAADPAYPAIIEPTVVGSTLYFATWSIYQGGTVLWKTDGTTVGTEPVATISPTLAGPLVTDLVDFGGTLFFQALTATGKELWRSDGTALGTLKVADIEPTFDPPSAFLTAAATRLYFFGQDANGRGLFASNGTTAGTARVQSLGATPGFSDALRAVGDRLFFTVDLGRTLWTSDGTAGGTAPVLASTGAAALTASLAAAGGGLFFASTGGAAVSDVELWRVDVSTLATTRVADLVPGSAGSQPREITAAGSRVFFSAGSTSTLRGELWTTDGTAAGTSVIDVTPGTASASPSQLLVAGTRVFFLALDPTAPPGTVPPQELWTSDGTAAGTRQLANPASFPSPVDTTVYFSAGSLAQLWRTDGSLAGTVPIPGSPSSVVEKLAVGPQLALRVGLDDVVVHDPAAGTFTTLAHIPGPDACGVHACFDFGSFPSAFRRIGSTLYFLAASRAHGFSLWRSDLTAAGTQPIAPKLLIDHRYGFIPPWDAYELAVSDGHLFFPNDSASAAVLGNELWVSDGTVGGFGPVADVHPGPGSSDPSHLTDVAGTLFFTADDGTSGRELWRTDGTSAGTARVADIRPGSAGSDPQALAAVGSLLYFSADDGTTGRELWRTDGTASGTLRLTDLNPGAGDANPREIRAANGLVYFQATDGASGVELWRTDGTPTGTVRVADLVPGPGGSFPANLTPVNNLLFFSAFTDATGTELWTLSVGGGGGSDLDGDGIDDAVDPCVNVANRTMPDAVIKARGLATPAADDTLAVSGTLTVPVSPAIDPMANGLRIVVTRADGTTAIDATAPAGAFDRSTHAGWRVDRRRRFSFHAPSGILRGIRVRVVVPGRARVRATGGPAAVAIASTDLPLGLTIGLDPASQGAGQCADTSFRTAACATSARGKLRCGPDGRRSSGRAAGEAVSGDAAP